MLQCLRIQLEFWDWPVDSGFSVLIGSHTCLFLPAASPLGALKQNVEGGLLIVLLPV